MKRFCALLLALTMAFSGIAGAQPATQDTGADTGTAGTEAVSPAPPQAPAAAEFTAVEKLKTVEKILYGTAQTGPLLDRLTRIERDLFGAPSQDALLPRVDRLYAYMRDSSSEPSFLLKLSALEWMLTRGVTHQPGKNRIEAMENLVYGAVKTGGLDGRLDRLLKLAYANGQMDVTATTIPKDTLIKIKILTPLDTKKNRPGDRVAFEAMEDVTINGALVIAKGAWGMGKVTKVVPPKMFGQNAKLEVSFDTIEAVDATKVDTLLGEKAKERTEAMAAAAGASLVGAALLGPVGLIGGVFVQGNEIVVPVGTQMFIQTKADTDVWALRVN